MNNPLKILLFGGSGQVGQSLLRQPLFASAIAPASSLIHLENSEEILTALNEFQPTVVINAAAYTQVDRAELEPEIAYACNAEAPKILATWCFQKNIPLIHYSTDYVYSGEGSRAWTESDATHPINVYGKSKALGDAHIETIGGKYLILRTSWVYAAIGRNFLKAILTQVSEKKPLWVVSDQYGAPTFAVHLASLTASILEKALHHSVFPSGIYHCCHTGETTWKEFAKEILRELRIHYPIEAMTTNPSPKHAQRPLNSRLDTRKLLDTFDLTLPHWTTGLQACMKEIVFP